MREIVVAAVVAAEPALLFRVSESSIASAFVFAIEFVAATVAGDVCA